MIRILIILSLVHTTMFYNKIDVKLSKTPHRSCRQPYFHVTLDFVATSCYLILTSWGCYDSPDHSWPSLVSMQTGPVASPPRYTRIIARSRLANHGLSCCISLILCMFHHMPRHTVQNSSLSRLTMVAHRRFRAKWLFGTVWGSSCKKFCKIFQDFPSHQIFGRMHEALNINKK